MVFGAKRPYTRLLGCEGEQALGKDFGHGGPIHVACLVQALQKYPIGGDLRMPH